MGDVGVEKLVEALKDDARSGGIIRRIRSRFGITMVSTKSIKGELLGMMKLHAEHCDPSWSQARHLSIFVEPGVSIQERVCRAAH